MKTTEVSKDLIGRRCECIFTGMMVTGVIEDTEENEYSVNVKVRFDHPHQWPNRPQRFQRRGHVGRLFPARLGKQL